VTINKQIVIGLIMSGVVAQLLESEAEDKGTSSQIFLAVKTVEKKLYKKIYNFKNGGVSFQKKITKILSKKKKNKKDLLVLQKRDMYLSRYKVHVAIANGAWETLKDKTKEDFLSLNHLINSLACRPDVMVYYNFKKSELLQVIGGFNENDNGRPFSSLRVANKLVSSMEDEIAKYQKST